MFEAALTPREGEEILALTVQVREFNGGRSLEMTKAPGFVFVETEDQSFAFDERHFLHQIKRLMGISVILTMDEPEEDFALP